MNNKLNDKDYLPYTTNSYHQKAPYLVWNDRYSPHRKRKKKRCPLNNGQFQCCQGTSIVVAITSFMIIAIFAIISLSAYLGVITNFYTSPVFILHGRLSVKSGDDFAPSLLNKTSEEFQKKATKYEHLLQSVYEESIFKKSLANIKVHSFRNGSLFVYFRIYLHQSKLSNVSLKEASTVAKRILDNSLKNIRLQYGLEANVSFEKSELHGLHHQNVSQPERTYLLESHNITDELNVTSVKQADDVVTDINYVTTTEKAFGSTKDELKNVESHQNTKKTFVVSYGAWLPFIPTSHPVPTDRIITLSRSSTPSNKPTLIQSIHIDDDDDDLLLEERRLKQSMTVNSSELLLKLLSKIDLKPILSTAVQNKSANLERKPSNGTFVTNQNASNLFSYSTEVFSEMLANPNGNNNQAWVPIFLPNQSKTNSTSAISDIQKRAGTIGALPFLSDEGKWRGYSSTRRSDDSNYGETIVHSQSYVPSGRTAVGAAYAYPDTGFIPNVPVSTTELTVGASLYISHSRKNKPPPGNLRRIHPSSTTKRPEEVTDVDLSVPLYIRRPVPQIRRGNPPLSLSYGSEVGSLDVGHSLLVRHSNRSLHTKSIKSRELSNTSLIENTGINTDTTLSNLSGIAKIIASYVPINLKQLVTKSPTHTKENLDIQNGKPAGILKEIKPEAEETIATHSVVPFRDSKNKTNERNQDDQTGNFTNCASNQGFRCKNGNCYPWSVRCNKKFECEDMSDEINCSCIEYFWAKRLNGKICDGIIDCWDQTDESGCPWCSSDQFICPNTKQCINNSQICDGIEDCPFGSDESHCVTLTSEVNDIQNHHYKPEGHVAIRKKGVWGMLCSENFESGNSFFEIDIQLEMDRLGRSICSILSYRDVASVKKSSELTYRAKKYYQLDHLNTLSRSKLDVHETECKTQETLHVTCQSLECGIRPLLAINRSRIIGGHSSTSGSWPWQIALYKEGEFQCGAVLISDQWLLTAAHCFYYSKSAYWTARLGLLRRGNKFPSPYEEIRIISHIILNPNYEEVGFINDIALLRMNEPVTFSDYIRPTCLPQDNEPIKTWNDNLCTVVGWGKLFETGRLFPDTLQEVWIPVVDTDECRKRTIFLPLYKITDQMFCAGYERGGRDACLGDSGGPLLCQRSDGRWTVVGVTSNGDGCGRPGRPGVYTKVSSFLNWIHSTIEREYSPSVPPACHGHRCQLGKCIEQAKICDRIMDCWDGSDERCTILPEMNYAEHK